MDEDVNKRVAVLEVQYAGLAESLKGIKSTLDNIFLSLIVGMAGTAGAAIYTWAYHLKP